MPGYFQVKSETRKRKAEGNGGIKMYEEEANRRIQETLGAVDHDPVTFINIVRRALKEARHVFERGKMALNAGAPSDDQSDGSASVGEAKVLFVTAFRMAELGLPGGPLHESVFGVREGISCSAVQSQKLLASLQCLVARGWKNFAILCTQVEPCDHCLVVQYAEHAIYLLEACLNSADAPKPTSNKTKGKQAEKHDALYWSLCNMYRLAFFHSGVESAQNLPTMVFMAEVRFDELDGHEQPRTLPIPFTAAPFYSGINDCGSFKYSRQSDRYLRNGR